MHYMHARSRVRSLSRMNIERYEVFCAIKHGHAKEAMSRRKPADVVVAIASSITIGLAYASDDRISRLETSIEGVTSFRKRFSKPRAQELEEVVADDLTSPLLTDP
eukprot:m.164369 g.164369  ORF g.164369 m.164369 type:complete len:106 (+) comp53104_c0_seq3:84-401(+)